MSRFFLTPDAENAGKRIDAYISDNTDLSRSRVQSLIESGNVLISGNPCKKNAKTALGAEITVILPENTECGAFPQDIPLDIVYEDDCLILINKPKGMVVHPAAGNADGTLVNALLFHCGDTLSGIGGVLRPGIVHRLDKLTSGLIIAAKTDAAHAALSAQLKDRSLSRIYHALVQGGLPEDEGSINTPIGRSQKDRKKMAVTPSGRDALTYYKVIARYSGFTHAECRLQTGRTHQIRVHFASIGHPVAGDTVYGGKTIPRIDGQLLHAKSIAFDHPETGERMEFSVPLPDFFQAELDKLKEK